MSTGPRGSAGTIGPQGIRGERGHTGNTGATGCTGPEGLSRCFYENAVVVRGATDTLKGLKFDLSKVAKSAVVQHVVPGTSTDLVGTSTVQLLTNKDLEDPSNKCRATLLSTGEVESVSLPKKKPEEGQVLVATNDCNELRWEHPGRLLQTTAFAFSVFKNILVLEAPTMMTTIGNYDEVKLAQPSGSFNAEAGFYNVLSDGLFNISFTANVSTDEVYSILYFDLMNDEEVLCRQQVSMSNGVASYPVTLLALSFLSKGSKIYMKVTPGTHDLAPPTTLCYINFNGLCALVA